LKKKPLYTSVFREENDEI